jgi:hypothetical protein
LTGQHLKNENEKELHSEKKKRKPYQVVSIRAVLVNVTGRNVTELVSQGLHAISQRNGVGLNIQEVLQLFLIAHSSPFGFFARHSFAETIHIFNGVTDGHLAGFHVAWGLEEQMSKKKKKKKKAPLYSGVFPLVPLEKIDCNSSHN